MKNTTITRSCIGETKDPVAILGKALEGRQREAALIMAGANDASRVALAYLELSSSQRERVWAMLQAEVARGSEGKHIDQEMLDEFYAVASDIISGRGLEEIQQAFGMHTSQYSRYEHTWKWLKQIAGGRCFTARRKDPPVAGSKTADDLVGRCRRCGACLGKRCGCRLDGG